MNGDGKIDSIDFDGDGIIDGVVPNRRPAQPVAQAPPTYSVGAPPAYGQQAYAVPLQQQPMQYPNMPVQAGQQHAQYAARQQAPQYAYPQQATAYVQGQTATYAHPQQAAYVQGQTAYVQRQTATYQAAQAVPVYQASPSAPPAYQASQAAQAQPQLLDFRNQDQRLRAANPNAVAVQGNNGLLVAGDGANKNGPKNKKSTKAVAGAAAGTAAAVGAGVAIAANPEVVSGAAEVIGEGAGALGDVAGDLISGAVNVIGSLFR